MIWEIATLAVCLYGLMREGDVLKVAAVVSMLAYPALMLFSEAGAGQVVLLLLAIEAVPFAFALLVLRRSGLRDYREVDR